MSSKGILIKTFSAEIVSSLQRLVAKFSFSQTLAEHLIFHKLQRLATTRFNQLQVSVATISAISTPTTVLETSKQRTMLPGGACLCTFAEEVVGCIGKMEKGE